MGGGSCDEISAGTTAAAVVGTGGLGGEAGVVGVAVDKGTVFGAAGPHPVKKAVRVRTKANCRVKNTPGRLIQEAENGVSLCEGRKPSQPVSTVARRCNFKRIGALGKFEI